MKFRTELVPALPAWTIGLDDPLVTMGSCFSDTLGGALLCRKFKATVNPFGNTYHPLSIDRLVQYALSNQSPDDDTYVERAGIFFNYELHSSFSGETLAELKNSIQSRIEEVHQALARCPVLVLTYGTAWIFERVDTGHPVANCHRLPAGEFNRRLTTVGEITQSFTKTFNKLRSINPDFRVILTVSPVRHLRDSLPSNSVSKATLRLACHELASGNDRVHYFPAFELLMDDLRDYRFYSDDLIHPSKQAERYIWDKFRETYFSQDTMEILSRWDDLRPALQHQPFHPESASHQQFLRQTIDRLTQLLPVMDVRNELASLQSQLNHQPA